MRGREPPLDFPRQPALPKERCRGMRWNILRARNGAVKHFWSDSLPPAVKIFQLTRTVNIRRIVEVDRRIRGRGKTVLAVSRCQISMSVLFYELGNVALWRSSLLCIAFCTGTAMHKALFRSGVYNDRGGNAQTPPHLMTRERNPVSGTKNIRLPAKRDLNIVRGNFFDISNRLYFQSQSITGDLIFTCSKEDRSKTDCF